MEFGYRQRVEITRSRIGLLGKKGRVTDYDPANHRYTVRLDDGTSWYIFYDELKAA